MPGARARTPAVTGDGALFGELDAASCAVLDQAATEHTPLSFVWEDLIANRLRVHSCVFSERRCFLILSPVSGERTDRRLAPRRVRILERILLGEGQKSVALALSVAPSTVTLLSGECLRAMGLECGTSRVPAALVMAAYAAKGLGNFREGTLSEVSVGERSFLMIGMRRPDATLPEQLSRNEAAVVRLLVEGKCHAEIASAQGKSERTVANQLASAFHKLNVSGRAELLCRLIARPQSERPRSRAVRAL